MIPPTSGERNPVVREYSRLAGSYDSKWSSYVEATTRETLARLSVRPADRVLDLGCGTGALLERLARTQPQARLTGVDPVPEMLAIARNRLPPEVELREGWAERLPFADGSFDVVVSCNMFHYIRQPVAALREMGRVLRSVQDQSALGPDDREGREPELKLASKASTAPRRVPT